MRNFNFLILLGIIALTTPIPPTLAADIEAGPLVGAAGKDPSGGPWDANCAGNVKIIDDQTITIENFKISPSPWGQVVAFSTDPYGGTWPDANGSDPTKDLRPLDAVFVPDGIANDDPKCKTLTDPPATLKVKAEGKKITKDTKFIGVYCLDINALFCRVDVTGKLDALVTTDTAPQQKCSSKYTDCWYTGGDDKCKKVETGSPSPVAGGGLALTNFKWTPLLSVGLVAVMLAFPSSMK